MFLQRLLEEAEQTMTETTSARVRAEQALLDARETWQARRVLGRLDPDLQIVLTTAHPELLDALPADHLITQEGAHLF